MTKEEGRRWSVRNDGGGGDPLFTEYHASWTCHLLFELDASFLSLLADVNHGESEERRDKSFVYQAVARVSER
ncbi:hypothetical protein AU210_016249 [Fusarium oxysporum f. sp. radicis-cucumerinum]|uniref:Uncharacterized protein n=1 Tax=Fusarium oxysporum f. sp. radicis-cucumerinum TaxID=327505 RepID=A0A2H3G6E9_FUSOX|nr:hypothetical protein AU210_016249 [Fusarium oxysporum f. sp. radicis-cucumerinum]